MSVNQYRLLGFAFAGADLLVEIGPAGKIQFAIGAAGRVRKADAADLVGSNWRDLIAADDHPLIESLLAGLTNGTRRGPVNVELMGPDGETPRLVAFNACMMPQLAPAISCSISASAAQGLAGAPAVAGPNKLHDAQSLQALAEGMWNVARGTGGAVDMCLVEVKGLKDIMEQRPDEGQKALRGIAGALRANSYGGSSAAQLEDERFALLREQGAPVEGLIGEVAGAVQRILGPDAPLAVGASAIAFEPLEAPEQAFRALRFAINQFVSEGLSKQPASSLGGVFQDLVADTMNKAGAFKAVVEARKFKLAFQPVVSLADGSIHHYEVLARFAEGESPFGLIRLAEEMELIERFDMVMIETVIARLREKDAAGLQFAVNISGQSMMSPGFVEALIRLLKASPGCARRLLFEVTESAALTDLQLADRHIQALRKAGFPVCLDDFGAGAASYPYLRMLTVDAVKIDGQYIRELGRSERDADLVRHLAALCRSLNVKTTAEMVESEDVLAQLKQLNVDYGQGWIFGKPGATPQRRITSLGARREAG